MILLVKSGGPSALPEWEKHFSDFAPWLEVRAWDDSGVDPAQVQFVLVWEPPAGWLTQFPQLRLILSTAAGVDHILCDPFLPPAVPIVRMVTPETVERMGDFVCLAALSLLRDFPALLAAQSSREWRSDLTGNLSSNMTVGVMGLGHLGMASSRRLAALGFNVIGWASSPKQSEIGRSYVGFREYDSFLSRSDILVNLLPQTPATHHILDANAFCKLPSDACLINVGRGSHVDYEALLYALDQGHLKSAFLDVFDIEPLPLSSRIWTHSKIIVTPHIASTVSRRARAKQAVITIQQFLADATKISFVCDRAAGY
jgi:glyoxylate/hydroxypyruvate reductase A